MKKFDAILPIAGCVLLAATHSSAFSYQPHLVDLSPMAQRDVNTMSNWAAECGVQQSEGIQLTSYDGQDYFPMTASDLPSGTCVMYVPNDIVFSSSKAIQEFGSYLQDCENQLVAAGLDDKVPLFRIFFKIIAEYEKGDQSPWFAWLNSLPRMYNNGASMTYDCFACLPPYAGHGAFKERTNLLNFKKAVGRATPGSSPFSPDILNDGETLKWAYNVASTRSIEMNGERFLAPMIDMFNHGAETEVEISYDASTGDCYAYSTVDVPAGSPLRVSYGDPTDPMPLFVTYGFLDKSSPGTFCKIMDMREEMEELGYGYSNLLFYRDGSISPEVYNLVLYNFLKKNADPNANSLGQALYQAIISGDEATKAQYQEQYWEYTKQELQSHVDGLLGDLDKWSMKASTYDLNTHPRVPLILEHNGFVKETFLNVKANLDSM